MLLGPLRKRSIDPHALLEPFVRAQMTVLDAGCAMGFFSLPIAGMVGPGGRVVCVDVQKRMISGLVRRARKAGLLERIDARVCNQNSLMLGDLVGRIDFALAFAVVHELLDRAHFFEEVHRSLVKGGRLLVAEPKRRVSAGMFRESVELAVKKGFALEREWETASSRLTVFAGNR